MNWLLADIGGTNTRIAFTGPNGPIVSARVENDGYTSFDNLLDEHLPTDMKFAAACVATAGPVTAGGARLTNRNWAISSAILEKRLGAPVTLINDLAALAAGVAHIGAGGLAPLNQHPVDARQPVTVLNCGTGVNICSAQPDHRGDPVLWPSEIGHSALPSSVAAHFADPPATVEQTFAGKSIANLTGATDGRQATSDPDLSTPRATWARAAGAYVQEVLWITRPLGGLLLAGSVLRGILASDAREIFLDACSPQPRAGVDLSAIPLAAITDDAAGLYGCRAVLKGLS